MALTISIISLVASILSGIGAVGAWRAAGRANRHAEEANELARKANALAEQANETNTKTAAIEQAKRHNDLRPQFEFKFVRSSGGQPAQLEVKLAGPAELGRLDAVAISIRDDDMRARPSASSSADDDIEDYIWGPYRFRPGIGGTDQAGRHLGEFSIEVGDSRRFLLDLTVEPQGHVPPGSWRQSQQGKRIRLTVTSTHEGLDPWTDVDEVRTPAVIRAF